MHCTAYFVFNEKLLRKCSHQSKSKQKKEKKNYCRKAKHRKQQREQQHNFSRVAQLFSTTNFPYAYAGKERNT